MLKRIAHWWWLPGFGVILIGCFFLSVGIASRWRSPVGVIELVDGIVIAIICFIVGALTLRRHAPDPPSTKKKDEEPRS